MNPQPTTPAWCTEDLERLDQALEHETTTRRDQLDRLPPVEVDPIANVQRAALRQTLAEISATRQRIATGSYGACTSCRQPISPERLEFRPWSATCVRCASR